MSILPLHRLLDLQVTEELVSSLRATGRSGARRAAVVPPPPPYVPDTIDVGVHGLVVEPMVGADRVSTFREPYHFLVFRYYDDTCIIPLNTFQNRFLPEPRWKVNNFDPLTLSPSLDFRDWKLHGWITRGRWT